MEILDDKYELRQRIGLWLGPLLCVILLLMPVPSGLKPAAWHLTAAILWIVIWWITEPIPIPATSLLPLVLFPILGGESIEKVAAPYADPVVYLFLGGFLIALAMQKWQLHKRIALSIIKRTGTSPQRLILGFMISTAFISMWINNTATTMMMLPIALSVVQLLGGGGVSKDERNFVIVLMLAIAHASTIGGLGTLIGTAPNAFFAGFVAKTYPISINFTTWMLAGAPLVLIAIPLTFWVLTKFVFPITVKEIEGADALIEAEVAEMGKMTKEEKMVLGVFLFVVVLWLTRSLDESLKWNFLPKNLSDAGISIFAGLLLFVLPSDLKKGKFVLDWETAKGLPWGLFLLFGGGLSVAAMVKTSGLAEWIGGSLQGMGTLPPIVIVFLVVAMMIFLTELTSNTAICAIFLPILGPVAISMGQNPLFLMLPATIAASTGFMMPVGTPPNAIVYGTGYLTVKDMMRAGIWLNLMFVVLVTIFSYTIFMWAFGIESGVVPAWAK